MSFDDQSCADGQRRNTGIRETGFEVFVITFGNMPGLVQGCRTELGISQHVLCYGNEPQIFSALVYALSKFRAQSRNEEQTLRLTIEDPTEGILATDLLCRELSITRVQ